MYQEFQNLIEELDEENDLEIYNILQPRQYVIRYRPNNFEKWSDTEFVQRFRLSKATVQHLLRRIENSLLHRTNRNHAVPPLQQLLLGLRFLATGSFYISVGDFAGLHKSTAGKIIDRVCTALVRLQQEHIYLPRSQNEILLIQEGFYEIARFPRVVAAIDCTQIKIQSPGGLHAENFRCRKGYFSLNIQAMCDSSLRFIDVVGRWPGATHDSTIFNNSLVCARFENGDFGNAILLGDSGYPLKDYLITPLAEPVNNAEQLFNESQIRSRNVIERAFGMWKRRFPILSTGIRCKIPLAQKIIVATAILHNIAVSKQEELPDAANDDDIGNIQEELPPRNNENNNVRRELIDYFGSLV